MERRTRFFVLLFATSIVVAGVGVVLFFSLRLATPPPLVSPDPRQPRLIDGVLVPPDRVRERLVAVVIDAMIDGRPTVGLHSASLVWETPVEGGITRFLAVYPMSALPAMVGPIRSLRPYFLDFAKEVDALLLHVGGSPEALSRAATEPVLRLNQFFDDVYFWRSADRRAPHNVFTSQYLVNRAVGERSYANTSNLDTWPYRSEDAFGLRTESEVEIVYATPPYTVRWQWNPIAKQYERFMGGESHRDADGTKITAANILIQSTAITILDAVGRRQIVTEGEGDGWVLRGGETIAARWRKEAGGRTHFYSRVHDEAIALDPGTTWIEVVSPQVTLQHFN